MKKITTILLGFLITFISGIILTNITPPLVSKFIPTLLGSFFVGCIIKEKGWFFGILIAGLNIIAIITVLKLIALPLQEKPVLSISLLEIFFLFIGGALGGFIGEICSKKFRSFPIIKKS